MGVLAKNNRIKEREQKTEGGRTTSVYDESIWIKCVAVRGMQSVCVCVCVRKERRGGVTCANLITSRAIDVCVNKGQRWALQSLYTILRVTHALVFSKVK